MEPRQTLPAERMCRTEKEMFNLIAEHSLSSVVSFISKSQLINHYEKSLGAYHFGGRLMIIETKAALKLIDKYFQNL